MSHVLVGGFFTTEPQGNSEVQVLAVFFKGLYDLISATYLPGI